jgi:hypothetical protein
MWGSMHRNAGQNAENTSLSGRQDEMQGPPLRAGGGVKNLAKFPGLWARHNP